MNASNISQPSRVSRRQALRMAGGLALGLGLSPWLSRAVRAADEPRKKLLFFTKSSGFQHSCITRKDPKKLSHAEQVLTDVGGAHGFDVTCTKDGTVFTPENLKTYDGLVFVTTGDLTTPGEHNDGPPMSKEGKAAFLDMVKEGKLGFAAFHCGSDTFHSPGTVKGKPNFIRDPELDPYIQMLGGEFVIHGKHQPGTLQVTDSKFPGAPEKELHYDLEEWYSLKNFDPNLHVIMVQETPGMAGTMYMRKPYPETWARMHGKGRVFYSSLGHYEQVWSSQEFQKLMIGALNWTTGRVEADVTPNLDKAAPGAEMTENPPEEPKVAKPAKKAKKE